MNTDAKQESLFHDPVGLRIRQAREKAQLTREQVAQRLKMPLAIIEAIEREDWPRLGAPIYVRSYLSSYLKLVGLPVNLADRAAVQAVPPALIAMDSRSRVQGTLDRTVRNLVYLVMTGVIVVPIAWLAMHFDGKSLPAPPLFLEAGPQVEQTLELEAPPAVVSPSPGVDSTPSLPGPSREAAPAPQPLDVAPVDSAPPVVASLAPFGRTETAASGSNDIHLRFRGESWLEVMAADGRRLERGLVTAGSERRYAPGEAARITVGNAEVVDVLKSGATLDLTPYREANVARFTVSSANDVAPAGD